MQNSNTAFYFSAGINDISWERIVHFYGRATRFPGYFSDLLEADTERQHNAITALTGNIEHQDGIIMATPFTLIFLFRLLCFEHTNKTMLLQSILTVARAVRFQYSLQEEDQKQTSLLSMQDFLNGSYLWPAFESDSRDEELWTEFDYNEQYGYWLHYCLDIIMSYSFLLQQSSGEKESVIAQKIIDCTRIP